MTTPCDFVKQDSPLILQQRCESFLDQLATKGATDTLSLLEELLETFPVSRATAILILWDWQEKRAPSTQCEHGQLARQCLLCEQAAEIERLTQRNNELRTANGFAELEAEVERLRAAIEALEERETVALEMRDRAMQESVTAQREVERLRTALADVVRGFDHGYVGSISPTANRARAALRGEGE